MSGCTSGDTELLKLFKTLAENEDATESKAGIIAHETKKKWERAVEGVTTVRLIADAMENTKIAASEDARKNVHAVMKQLVKAKQPIQEDDGEIMNMRSAVMNELDKMNVEPEELYSTQQHGTFLISLQSGGTTGWFSLRRPCNVSLLASFYLLMRSVSHRICRMHRCNG